MKMHRPLISVTVSYLSWQKTRCSHIAWQPYFVNDCTAWGSDGMGSGVRVTNCKRCTFLSRSSRNATPCRLPGAQAQQAVAIMSEDIRMKPYELHYMAGAMESITAGNKMNYINLSWFLLYITQRATGLEIENVSNRTRISSKARMKRVKDTF
jgi:hypothetical protein